jgi:hypothetical protein
MFFDAEMPSGPTKRWYNFVTLEACPPRYASILLQEDTAECVVAPKGTLLVDWALVFGSFLLPLQTVLKSLNPPSIVVSVQG